MDDEVKRLKNELEKIETALETTPKPSQEEKTTKEKWITLGRIQEKLKQLDSDDSSGEIIEKEIQEKESELETVKETVESIDEKRYRTIAALNEYIQEYILFSKDALQEYGEFKADFDYKNAVLWLRKSGTQMVESITSSSDLLFMHLSLFAGIHAMLLANANPYVPQFLILDQPTQPYFKQNSQKDYDYRNGKKVLDNEGDWSKVLLIFRLWDHFVQDALQKNQDFQLIVLEHVPVEAWKDCKNVHLVEEFDGKENALIPPSYFKK